MIEDLKDWAGLVALLLSIGTTIYAWLTSKSRVNAEHLKGVDTKLTDHDRRIQTIEGELRHMPAKDDVNDLKLALAELRGMVGRLDESLTGTNRAVRRMEDYLVKEKAR